MSALQRAVVRVGLVLLLSSMGIVQSGSVPQVMADVGPTIMPDPGPPGATQLGGLPEFGDVQAGAVISKTAPAEIMAGELLTYTIVASDGGLGAVVTDAVPYDTWYVAGSMGYTPPGSTVVHDRAEPTQRWLGNDVGDGVP